MDHYLSNDDLTLIARAVTEQTRAAVGELLEAQVRVIEDLVQRVVCLEQALGIHESGVHH